MRDRIKAILKESFGDFGSWFDEAEPTFKNWDFKFDGKHEYWVDISMLNADEHKIIFDYIKKTVPNYSNTAIQFDRTGFYNGVVIHCGNEDNDYFPEENYICFMTEKFDEDSNNYNSIYIDGGEVLEYIDATKQNIKEASGWTDEKDSVYWSDDSLHWGTDSSFSGKDPDWEPNPDKSYWKQGSGGGSTTSSAGGEETVKEEENLLDDENPFDWLNKEKAAPNYEGFPQGVVYLRDHDEIDMFVNLINKINPKDFEGRHVEHDMHNALEGRRDELEFEGYDSSDALLSASFFVEKNYPGGLSIGYWSWDVDDETIMEWLNYQGETFNKDYELYTSLDKLEKVLKYY